MTIENNEQLDGDTKARLGVLWVLLNSTTETKVTDQSIAVMRAIEHLDPTARRMWNQPFQIVTPSGEVLFSWKLWQPWTEARP